MTYLAIQQQKVNGLSKKEVKVVSASESIHLQHSKWLRMTSGFIGSMTNAFGTSDVTGTSCQPD